MLSFFDRSFGFSLDSITPGADFPRETEIDLRRYMRDWYVIAHKPPSLTRTAHNAVERYRHNQAGRIDVEFTFRKDSFQGDKKTMRPVGYVVPGTGDAVWAMQFFWPIKMQFVIAYVDPDYRTTIVARERRDFVWIMAGEPEIDAAEYDELVGRVVRLGYDKNDLRMMPQQPTSERASD